MDVARLRVLRALADRGTVTAAARSLSLTPSAVSQQLKVLAREAGVALVEPDGRRLRLTDAGRALVVRADEVLAALDRAQAEMDAHAGAPHGLVRVAASFPSGAEMFFPDLLRRTAATAVRIELSDHDVPHPRSQELLADADVLLTHRDERSPAPRGARVQSSLLLREPVDVVLPAEHALAGAGRVELAQLRDEPWVSVADGFMIDEILRSLATLTGVQPRVVQRVNDFRVMAALVRVGVGVALMPRHSATHPGTARCTLAGIRAARTVDVLVRPHAARRPAVAIVLQALRATAAELA